MKYLSSLVIVLLFISGLSAQEGVYHSFDDGLLTLDNGQIRRVIEVNNAFGQFTSVFLGIPGDEFNYLNHPNVATREFGFEVFGIGVSGANRWEFLGVEEAEDPSGGKGAVVSLKGTGIMGNLEVRVAYMLYPDLPVIRKMITVINNGDTDLQLEAVDVEHVALKAFPTLTEVYRKYSRHKHIGPLVGDWDDPVVALHMPEHERGVILGNEAPGVLKRIAYYQDRDDFSAGLTHTDQPYPFRKWLEPGASFTAPPVFLMLYKGERSPYHALNFDLPDFVRKHMGLEVFKKEYKPLFIYNTWVPFRHNVNEVLVQELADAAEACGVKEFVIDDGWQTNTRTAEGGEGFYTNVGDYMIDSGKFPNGLKPVFDYIKKRGMQPGLWLSIGSANSTADVFHEHPEWFVQDARGEPANLHSTDDKTMLTACMSTGWKSHIRDIIIDLCDEHGLTYTKLDFASVTSAYVNDPAISGCYATDHPGHRDHSESLYANYAGLFELFDDLQKGAPELFIDCTFETQGKLHMIDYAFLKHAEGNWLANIEEEPPYGSLRVRHLAWERAPVIPACGMVIGNLRLDSEDLEYDFLSLAGTFPIMLGDIRETPEEKREWLKKQSDWLEEMQEAYDYMSYRQDLRGFGEPMEGHWDGWQRINTDTREGGIVGVFRHGSPESSRVVTVEGLDPEAGYAIVDPGSGDSVVEMTGEELRTKGFEVEMERLYQGKVWEVKSKK